MKTQPSSDLNTGFTERVCIQCSNGIDKVQVKEWSVTQRPPKVDCTDVLKIQKVENNTIEFPFNNFNEVELPISKLINNTLGAKVCNPFNCQILVPGCTEKSNSTQIKTKMDQTEI